MRNTSSLVMVEATRSAGPPVCAPLAVLASTCRTWLAWFLASVGESNMELLLVKCMILKE